jgi:HAD superfamily hydrolase (TIGR01509 family)
VIITSQSTNLLFDLDGTLIDSSPAHEQAFRRALSDVGLDAFVSYATIAGMKTADAAQKLGVPAMQLDAFTLAKRAHYVELVRSGFVPAVDGAENLLESARALGWTMGLVTSASTKSVDLILDEFGWAPYFECVITGDEVERGKPFPDAFQLGLERLRCESSSAIGIEDSDAGIEALRLAGIESVRVGPGGRRLQDVFELLALAGSR